jgi:hypothetical protein
MDDASPTGLSTQAGSPLAEALAGARRASNAAGIPQAWSTAPKPFQAAVAARNDAIELGWSMLDVIGRLSGGAGPQFIAAGVIDGFIGRISRLSTAIAQSPSGPSADNDTARVDPLTSTTQNMLAQSSMLRSLQDQLLASMTAEAGSSGCASCAAGTYAAAPGAEDGGEKFGQAGAGAFNAGWNQAGGDDGGF